MSFVYVNGGQPVAVSQQGYLFYEIDEDLTLFWANEFIDSLNRVAGWMEIDATDANLSVIMPDATFVSPGQSTVIFNVGNNEFDIKDSDGNIIVPDLEAGKGYLLVIKDNTTAEGAWITSPFVASAPSVTSIEAVSNTAGNIVITGTPANPITNAGQFTFTLGNDLAQLTGFGTDVGLSVRVAQNDWELRDIAGTLNQIIVTNGDGVAGNPTIGLATTLTNLVSITVGNINIQANTISSTNANGDINLTPNGTGNIVTTGSIIIQDNKKAVFYNGANSNYISFSAGNRNTSQDYVWPTDDPLDGQLMGFVSAGNLGWFSVQTFSGISQVNHIARYSNTIGTIKNSEVIIDDAGNMTGVNSIVVQDLLLCTTGATTIASSAGNVTISPSGASELVSSNSIRIRTQNALLFNNVSDTAFTALRADNGAGGALFSLPNAYPANDLGIMQSTLGGVWSFSPLTATIATKAIMEAGVSNINPVVPSNFMYHSAAQKAWIRFNGSGGGSVISAYNASLTKNSAGKYTIGFPNAFNSINYTISCLATCTNSSDSTTFPNISYGNSSGGSIDIYIYDHGVIPAPLDPTDVCLMASGVLA